MSHAGSCLGYICTCGQDHSDKNRSWCDRSDLQIENDYLRAENARYREALEFYADDKNWIIRDDVQDVCVNDWSKKEKHSIPTAGNRAREALKGE